MTSKECCNSANTCCPSKVATVTHEFYADMSCDGCKNAITRILGKESDVIKLDVDVASKKVAVVVPNNVSASSIQDRLAKWAESSKKEVKFVKTY